jgi:hypothetical protein
MIKNVTFFMALLFLFGACKKTEEVTISGNTPPPDYTIENAVYESYINRTYILVLGTEPDSAEMEAAKAILKPAGMGGTSRTQFLNLVFAHAIYRNNVYTQFNVDYLDNLDSAEVSNMIFVFNYVLSDTTFQYSWDEAARQLVKAQQLQTAPSKYVAGQISAKDLQRIMIDNYFFDQINKGTLNFVNKSFNLMLDRNPSLSEQQAAVTMCDGTSASLLLHSGYSKDDYLSIIFGSTDYYEACVKKFYRRYLLREPDTDELISGTQMYQSSNDYESVQKQILSSNEFIGIN